MPPLIATGGTTNASSGRRTSIIDTNRGGLPFENKKEQTPKLQPELRGFCNPRSVIRG